MTAGVAGTVASWPNLSIRSLESILSGTEPEALGPEIGTGTAEEVGWRNPGLQLHNFSFTSPKVAIAWPSEGVRTAESGKSGGEKAWSLDAQCRRV